MYSYQYKYCFVGYQVLKKNIILCDDEREEKTLGKREIEIPEVVWTWNAFQFFAQLDNNSQINLQAHHMNYTRNASIY